MSKTKNTTKEPKIEWLFGGNPNAIEQQEAQGQRELIESQQLPRKCNSPRGMNAAEQYSKMGIKVFTSSKGDDLFIGVKLPNGWKKEATEHSMWNNLVDDKGRIRATFFYKAAFYDRDAFINFTRRYQIETSFADEKTYAYFVKDNATGKSVFDAGDMSREMGDEYFDKQDELQLRCKHWLQKNYPNYEDINAYWD